MKKLVVSAIVAVVAYQVAAQLYVVNDTWKDGTRTDPAAPVYSELGVDTDSDSDIESAWFRGGSGSMSVVDIGGGVNVLQTTVGTSSATWTTYFGDLTLGLGNKLILTWVFTPYNVHVGNSSQGFRMAIYDSATWLTADGSPADQDFYGYAIFQNFATVLNRGNNDNLDIMERLVRNGNLLATGANWTKRAGAGSQGNEGFVDGTQYTFVFSAERLAAGLQLTASFSGGNIDNSGTLLASYLDDTPDTFSFSGFSIRPNMSTSAAERFDTSLFRVEFIPEPGTVAILGLAAIGALLGVRRIRK